MGFKFQGSFLGFIFQSGWDSGFKFQMGGIQDSNYVFRGPTIDSKLFVISLYYNLPISRINIVFGLFLPHPTLGQETRSQLVQECPLVSVYTLRTKKYCTDVDIPYLLLVILTSSQIDYQLAS